MRPSSAPKESSRSDGAGSGGRLDLAANPACHSDRRLPAGAAAATTRNTTTRTSNSTSTVRISPQPNSGGTVMLPGGGGVGSGAMAPSVREDALRGAPAAGGLIRPRDVTQRDGRTGPPPV